MAQDVGVGSGKIRLFVDACLSEGADVALSRDQAHYLFNVMRQGPGSAILLFNGRDGEWAAAVTRADRKGGRLTCRHRTRPQEKTPDLWLLFAPIKKARTDFIAEKACEMGCRRLLPVFTERTNSARVNLDRLRAHAIEAAEQCGLTAVPEVVAPQSLGALLDGWDRSRRLLFCDESGAGEPVAPMLARLGGGPWAVLIGPEGGFSTGERARLGEIPWAHAASLGPRVLRADTAAVAALTIWQSVLGDWT